MNKIIHQLLSLLKEHVNQNNNEMQFNQEEIDKLLSEAALNPRKKDLDSMYFLNRQLLNENSDFIKMQLGLSEFLEKYKHLFPSSPAENPLKKNNDGAPNKLLMLTVSGKIKFDPSHPKFDNPQFIDELLKYYETNENYEMCDKLMKLRKLS